MKKLIALILPGISLCIYAQLPLLKQSPYPILDTQNMYNAIYTLPEQLEVSITLGKKIKLKYHDRKLKNIVFAGMGGSAIAGDIATTLCKDTASIPMITNRNYTLPNWVDKHSLVILLSYSGNTEETVSCMYDAIKRGAMIIGITAGGIIKQTLDEYKYTTITVPDGLLPRAALGYMTVPLLYILDQLDEIDPMFEINLTHLVKELRLYRLLLSDEFNKENFSYRVAQSIQNVTPLIYAEDGITDVIARRWRTQLAENAKIIALTHSIPEQNHNEIVAWQHHENKAQKYGILWILDSGMHPRNTKRHLITHDIIKNNIAYQTVIRCKGQTFLERMFFSLYIGDWVSYWAAIQQNIDPSPIDNIVMLKDKMSI